MKTLIVLLLLAVCSCSTPQRLSKTGSYTIDTVRPTGVTLKEVKGVYKIMSDTLKPGDKIIINVLRIKRS